MIITFQETGQDKCDDSGDGPQKNTTHFQKVWSSVEHYSREFVDSIKNTYRKLDQKLPIHNRRTGSFWPQTLLK